MSASDKKKQRKAEMAEGLTQRQQREQAEAQAAKQKKTVYTLVGTVCAAAAVALLVWNNAGIVHRGATAATVNGKDYKVVDLQYYYVQARNQLSSEYQAYAAYGISAPFDVYDISSDGEIWYNESEGQTYADYFREAALNNLKQSAALCAAAEADGYTLSEEGQQQIEDVFVNIDASCAAYGISRSSYFSQSYGNGVTEKVFRRNLTNDILATEYAQYRQDSISYEDADLMAYYNEHPDDLDSYDYRVFYIDGSASNPTDEEGNPLTDEDGNTITATDEEKEAAMTAAEEKAKAAVAEIEAASDREAAFIAAAPNYVAETSKGAYADPSYSLQEGVLGSNLTRYSSSIASWLMDSARKNGDVTLIESTNGYQVVMFLDRYLVEDSTVDIRHILIMAETTDEDETNESGVKVPTQAAMDAAKAEAESILAQWESGDKTAASFGQLAEEHSDDGGSNTNGGKYTYVSQGEMVENFDAWIFDSARQPGDTGLVENAGPNYYGWHIIYFEKVQEPAWKGTAISAKQNSDQSEWLNGLLEEVEAVSANGFKYVGGANNAVPTPTETPAESTDPDASATPEA